MMPYPIAHHGRIYTVIDDLAAGYRALIVGVVRDEITGDPLAIFDVQADAPGAQAKTLAGGLFCLSGRAEIILPDTTIVHPVPLTIRATGYRDVSLIVNVPIAPVFPVDAGPIAMRPLPVRLQGRVTKDKAGGNPIPNAKIISVDDPNPPVPLTDHFVVLRSPLQIAHASGVAVRERALSPTATVHPVALEALAGNRIVTLDNRAGINPGDIVRLGPEAQGDFGIVDALAPGPQDITLLRPLTHTLKIGAQVRRMTLGAPGVARQLNRSADAGDGVLILDGVLNVETVEIDPAPGLVEYHALGALSDADGFYRLDGIGRVRELHLTASAGGFQPMPAPLPWTIDYARPINLVNFLLSV